MKKKDKDLSQRSLIVAEFMYDDTGIIAFLLSIALKLKKAGGEIVGFQMLSSASYKEVFRKYNIRIIKWQILIIGALYSLKAIIQYLKFLFSTEAAIQDQFKIGNISSFGNFIDTLSIKHGVLWTKKNKSKVALDVLLEIIYFNYWKVFFKKNHNRIDVVVLGDTSYRYGYLATFSNYYSLPIVCNVDLNSLFLNYFHNGYKSSVTRPIYEFSAREIIERYPGYELEIDEYFSKRSKGEVLQHDVLKAYKSNKKLSLTIQADKKVTVAIFAHIFSDAPHNIPGLLFDSFLEWFIKTIEALLSNPCVYILIKEHPSVELYKGEKGLVKKILEEYFGNIENVQIVDSEIKPTEVILSVDYVITASGTVGLEAAYLKKDVIIAAKTPYSNQGIVHEFTDQASYLRALKEIQSIKKLSINSQSVKLCAFMYFLLFDNRNYYKDFPLPPYIRGEKFNCSVENFDALLKFVTSNNDFSKDLSVMIQNQITFFGPRLIK